MIQSMTGFGKSTAELSNKKISVEIKSLNSKQLDLNTRIPSIYREKEMQIRNTLMQSIERGKVDFLIYIENVDKNISSQINQGAVESYHEQIRVIAGNLNLALPSDPLSIILRLPDTIKTEYSEVDDSEWEALNKAIEDALSQFVNFRMQEGAMLEKLFIRKIENIGSLSKEIEKYEVERLERVRIKMQEALSKIDSGSYDQNRFEQEMIFYIERLDINEEKNRLDNHLKYFMETLNCEKAQGRKLGFIVQEIGREINTMGSKSNHVEMQKLVVQMKDELEQIKEQILNVL
ncbi:MAG: YicC family protein [Dysgonamonadaceae bacterium]|jgi:uncharacterized protein (TIGR00255 family)|nr:YicC family protein [Dysgonamonadaceae bacterium]